MVLMIIRLIELQITGSPDECLERYCSASIVEPLPDLVVFPELFCTGYDLDSIPALALSMNELRGHTIGKLAAEKGIWFAPGTFPVSTETGVVNRFPVFSPEGNLVWFTDKVHICGGVFDLDGIRSSGIVCYDLRFPELCRMVSLMGARLIIVPSEWPEPRLELFRALLMARAAEAQVFVAGCNLGGEHLGVRFGGGGAVAHPSGKLLGWKDVIERVRDFEIDPDDVLRTREKIDCLADRRPGAYEPAPRS